MGYHENKDIRKIYDECFALISEKYTVPKPMVYVYRSNSGRYGACHNNGSRIDINNWWYDKKGRDEVRKTILHELCHHINNRLFKRGKHYPGHNVQFFRLCREFGLTADDYYCKSRELCTAYDLDYDKEHSKYDIPLEEEKSNETMDRSPSTGSMSASLTR